VVLAPAGDDELRAYVEGLRPLDRSAWEELVADHPHLTTPPAPASTAPTTTVPAPTATATTSTTGPPPG
jgi:hypothetical protein